MHIHLPLIICFACGTVGGFIAACISLHILSKRIALRAERNAWVQAQTFHRHKSKERQ